MQTVKKICQQCGSEFDFNLRTGLKWAEKTGRGKFCSKRCQCDSRKGKRVSPDTEFKKGVLVGDKHPEWKGDKATYATIHKWLEYNLVRPDKCTHCGVSGKRIEWANKSHEYKRDLDDWVPLCKKCHVAYDRSSGMWGEARRRFSL